MKLSRGFTLTELVMVIVLIGVVSAVASSLFTRPAAFNAVSARDQFLAVALLAQKQAISGTAQSEPIFLRVAQSASEWTLTILRGNNALLSQNISRYGASVSVNGTALNNGGNNTIRYSSTSFTGGNYQWVIAADESYPFCITSTGFSHRGNCQP